MLIPKQQKFCDLYLGGMRAPDAAEAAGYSRKYACRLLQLKGVASYIANVSKNVEIDTTIGVEAIMNELATIAFADMRDMYNENGQLLPVKDWPEAVAKAVAAVESSTVVIEDGVTTSVHKVKRWDKLRALELMGKQLKMFRDVLEVNVTHDLADRLVRAKQKEIDVTPNI